MASEKMSIEEYDRLPLPVPKLVLPRYEPKDTFALFINFLEQQGCFYTKSVLLKELKALQILPSNIDNVSQVPISIAASLLDCCT